MATWHVGPFDNDDAVEWCAALESAGTDLRLDLVHRTLDVAIRAGPALAAADAKRTVAAAATVLQSLTNAQPSDSPYAPRFLLGRRDIVVSSALRQLAIRALHLVLADGSSWRVSWAGEVEEDDAITVVRELRAALAGTVS
jgi:hypothetical protein